MLFENNCELLHDFPVGTSRLLDNVRRALLQPICHALHRFCEGTAVCDSAGDRKLPMIDTMG